MLNIIPAKPEITKTTVEVVKPAEPRKFVLELNEQQMKLLVAIQARLYYGTGFITYDEWHKLDDEFFQNSYPEWKEVKEIQKWVESKG